MPYFDAYVMIDWSGGNSRRCWKNDCIWIARGARELREPETLSPASRTDAESEIRKTIAAYVASSAGARRVLVCADFGYGFPRGFATLLPPSGHAPWRVVWEYLRQHVVDDMDGRDGGRPTNRSNRFEVASAINGLAVTAGASPGPFWCLPSANGHRHITQGQPPKLFAWKGGSFGQKRITDRRAGSDTPFRLFGTGSVGSQILTGIPRLAKLRFDPGLAPSSVVWPFESGWAPSSGQWLSADQRIVHAEIYPSVQTPLPDPIKDCGQVRAMWQWARKLDARDELLKEFSRPSGLKEEDNIAILDEEGWILGCPVLQLPSSS